MSKESFIKNIERSWGLESLDSFLNIRISLVDPNIKSNYANTVLKPDHYSDHLLRKLWAIARDTKFPPEYVRRLLALAAIERLEVNVKGQQKYFCIVPRDVTKVAEKLGFDKSKSKSSLDLSELSDLSDLSDLPDSDDEVKVEDTIVAVGVPAMSPSSATTISEEANLPNGTSSNHVDTNRAVTGARFEVRIPESSSRNSTAASPSQRLSESSRPRVHPRPPPLAQSPAATQQSHSPVVIPATQPRAESRSSVASSPASVRQQRPLLPSTASETNNIRRQPDPPRPVDTTPVAQQTQAPYETPYSSRQSIATPASAKQPVAAPTPTRQPVTVPTPTRQSVAVPILPRQPVATPVSARQPTSTPASSRELTENRAPVAQMQVSDTPRPSVETPLTKRKPWSTTSTPKSERPWKRARTTVSEVELLEGKIRDLEYEIEVSTAQVKLHTRQLEKVRDNLKEEEMVLNQIRRYLLKENEINAEINEHAKVLTRLVKLHTEFRRTLSRDVHPANLDTPTLSEPVEPPPITFAAVIRSVSKYHDGFISDLEEAKRDVKKAEAAVLHWTKVFKETDQIRSSSQSGYEKQLRDLKRLTEQLEELRRQ